MMLNASNTIPKMTSGSTGTRVRVMPTAIIPKQMAMTGRRPMRVEMLPATGASIPKT